MRVAIIGGKLQGTEAVYLAKKAGFESVLFDRDENAPAAGLCDEFVRGDLLFPSVEVVSRLCDVDFILPATENREVLQQICGLAKGLCCPLAFDMEAYRITSSKLASDRLFRENGIPCPRYYPEAEPPYIGKPSEESGSSGVLRIETRDEAEELHRREPNYIIQEYLEGPSYSIEVIGVPGNYRAYEITKIHMDEVYDCKRVTAPCPVTAAQKREMEWIGIRLAGLIGLRGIMDVEVIESRGEMKVLEIDARLPSQTPTVVLHSRGVNLLEELADITVYGEFRSPAPAENDRYCSYEHFEIAEGRVWGRGEHLMSFPGKLTWQTAVLGSDEVISGQAGEKAGWRGTFINTAVTEEEVEAKRLDTLARLKKTAEASR